MSDVVLALLWELHRRQQRYDQVSHEWSLIRRAQVDGELIGLRVALGVALSYEAASGDVVPAAADFYRRWVASGTPDEVLP
ncbi:hypothetical protein F3K32_42555 [Streptomyces sp. LBUM 1483]|uniref:hypothetical protein n=1 Tax=Streptomyces scabiei TaxID=1930 RepID=UPI001B33A6EF|nr:hypothetical protein [Streptomyces sp. LBUM 1483]MBP5926691.1 hypothetical protein [Streptomyces sp. LBUM 1483]